MPKLYITYDPFDNKATFVPDGLMEPWAKNLIVGLRNGGEDMHVIVASDMPITILRVMIREGTIATDDIVFKFADKTVPHSPSGRIEHWPRGMGDWMSKLLLRLIA